MAARCASTPSPPPRVVRADDPEALTEAVEALRAGGVVGLPTDTVYGLAVLPTHDGLRGLIRAKRRPMDKGIPLLIDGLDQVAGMLDVPALAARLAERHWPGPLTLVLPLAEGVRLPEDLTGGRESLAVRVPDHAVPRSLARLVGPLAVSSANRSGDPEARNVADLLASVGSEAVLVIDGGPSIDGRPSSVVAVDRGGGMAILREGAIPAETLRAEGRSAGTL